MVDSYSRKYSCSEKKSTFWVENCICNLKYGFVILFNKFAKMVYLKYMADVIWPQYYNKKQTGLF